VVGSMLSVTAILLLMICLYVMFVDLSHLKF